LNSDNINHRILRERLRLIEGRQMAVEIMARIVLTREEIAHVYQGGVLSVKIKGKDRDASVEISCEDAAPTRGTRIRFRTVSAK
jgi:hypothetical protein